MLMQGTLLISLSGSQKPKQTSKRLKIRDGLVGHIRKSSAGVGGGQKRVMGVCENSPNMLCETVKE